MVRLDVLVSAVEVVCVVEVDELGLWLVCLPVELEPHLLTIGVEVGARLALLITTWPVVCGQGVESTRPVIENLPEAVATVSEQVLVGVTIVAIGEVGAGLLRVVTTLPCVGFQVGV